AMTRSLIALFVVLFCSFTVQSQWVPAELPGDEQIVRVIFTDTIDDVLYVAGSNSSQSPIQLCKYDGVNWECLGEFNGPIVAITRYQNKIFVGGMFSDANNTGIGALAVWDGTQWGNIGDIDGGVFNF